MKRHLLAALFLGGCLAGQPALPVLIDDLGTSQAVAAFRELDQNPDPAVFNALLEGTRHTQARVRAQCARLLGRKKDVTAIASLKAMLTDPDRASRVQAARALVVLADPEQVLEWLQDPQTTPPTREALADALVADQCEEVLPVLRTWLADKQQSLALRLIACRGLQDAGNRAQANELLLAQVKDASNDQELRARALEAYGSSAGAAGVPVLIEWLQRTPVKLQEGALRGLGHTRTPEAIRQLEKTYRDRSLGTHHRVLAVMAISESNKSDGARALVIGALEDPDPLVRRAAAKGLGCYIGQPGVKEAAHKARQNETNPHVEEELQCLSKCIECYEKCPPCTPSQ